MAEFSYWEERSIQNELKADKYAQNQARLITRFFNRAKKEMSSKITEFYKRYAEKEGISLKAAKVRLSDPNLLRTTLEEYYQLVEMSTNYDGAVNALNELSAKLFISREEFLKLQLNMIIDSAYIEYEDITTAALAQSFSDAYYKSQFDFEQFNGFGCNFNRLSINQIMAAVTTNWSGRNYSERIWGQRNSLSRKVNRIITTGMITGRSNKQMRQQLEKEVDCSTYNARRLIRTESSYVTNEARALAYEQNNTKKYEYVATLDLLTSEICRELDGKIFDVKDKQVGINYPPMHPHCRSTTAPAVEPDEDDTRAARDENGNTYRVPANMKYKEWYEKYVANNPEALLQEKCLKNISADNKQFQKYTSVLGKEMPKTLEDFQRMKYTDENEYGILKAQYKGMAYYNQAIKNEPEITKQVVETASTSNVNTTGLEYRIKTKESYLRKIRSNYDSNGNKYEINDILRYTYISDADNLSANTLKCIDTFSKKSYNTVKIKNSWMDNFNPYKGINTTVVAPNGQKFELQYHTQESFDLKNGKLHEIYEKQRLIKDKTSSEYIELRDKMFELSDTLAKPQNIERVKNK